MGTKRIIAAVAGVLVLQMGMVAMADEAAFLPIGKNSEDVIPKAGLASLEAKQLAQQFAELVGKDKPKDESLAQDSKKFKEIVELEVGTGTGAIKFDEE